MEKENGNSTHYVKVNFDGRETKYANEINNIAFNDFSGQELNMLFALMTNMQDRGGQRTAFSYSEMKKAMGLGNSHITNNEFMWKIVRMSAKLFCDTYIQTKKMRAPFLLFSEIIYEKEERQILLKVNPDFAYMLNNPGEYTKFHLEEFIRIDGKYAKLLYTHLRQYHTSGWYYVSMEDFKRLFCVPKSWDNKKIREKIIKPSIEKLRRLEEFRDLDWITKHPNYNKKLIEGYKFYWGASKSKETDREEKSAVSIEDVIAGEDAYDDDDLF